MDRRTFTKSIGALAGTAMIGGGEAYADTNANTNANTNAIVRAHDIAGQVELIESKLPERINDPRPGFVGIHLKLAFNYKDFNSLNKFYGGNLMYLDKWFFVDSRVPQGYALAYYKYNSRKICAFLDSCLNSPEFTLTRQGNIWFIKLDRLHRIKTLGPVDRQTVDKG